MEFTNTPRDVPPHRPAPDGASGPVPQRRVFSDFAPRPVSRPAAPQPMTPPTPSPAPATLRPMSQPAPHPAPHPHHTPSGPDSALRPTAAQPRMQPTHSMLTPTPTYAAAPASDTQALSSLSADQDDSAPTTSRPKTKSAHAGLAGFVCFVVFAALLLSPLLPGKILDNFPGSSQSLSSGDQTIGCTEDITNTSSSLAYNTKVGSPVVYNYRATTTLTGLCNGQRKTAVEGHTSQFNPLGLAADLLVALAVAIGIGQLWRLVFRPKD